MNPFLQAFDTPFDTVPFTRIQPEHFMPALQTAIAEVKATLQQLKARSPQGFEAFEVLEACDSRVQLISSVLFNLNASETSDALQAIAREASPLLSEYANDILLDEALFALIEKAYQQTAEATLSPEQQTLRQKTYKSFVRNGARLNEADKTRLRELDKSLSQLSLQFGEHVLAETNGYQLIIENEADLAGIPESIKEAAAEAAQQAGHEGAWLFGLQYPSYVPFMTYCQNRELREQLFRAFGAKGFQGNEFDNQEIVRQISALRHERAQLLGYASHAHFVLEERMAKDPQTVQAFLEELLEAATPAAKREIEELGTYAKQLDGIEHLERWDIAYYSEKLKKEKFTIDDETLKPYFRLENVIEGVFEVAKKLYGLHFIPRTDIELYHPEVQAYEVQNAQGQHIAVFYADFFPRAGKRSGAWMTSFRGQKRIQGQEQRPHISIVCNFTKPTASTPSLLTFNEVTTLFHEFGHALHGLLADTTYESLSGTSVYWDFVELPSQIMENWAYHQETLDLFAKHYQTGETIPAAMVQKIKDSANFMAGYQTLRQVGFALLDMAWHTQAAADNTNLTAFEDAAMQATQLLPAVEGTNMSTSFSHIFQGGYAAGYYSYKWAEVLDADAFELFLERGIFDPQTAQAFQEHILSKGGSEHPMALYQRFRGQAPDPKALLRRAGLLKA
ncbi:M3 family metallopeptidase [Eisenibacter elegans]|uniref:M3 family metallopeptidase n=1 Tax=Eisenibacter elegans TaxID=997 RepID=UPI0004068F59|nr:M3 family metallopeptidase [Eisenibacter elegans]